MVLPVEEAVVTLVAAVLAVAEVEGLAVAGLDVVDAGRDVEGPVVGLEAEKDMFKQHTNTRRKKTPNKFYHLNFCGPLFLLAKIQT